jgi:hypothetical protein
MELISYRNNGINTNYNYTIYKGSTTENGVLATQTVNNSTLNSVEPQTNTLVIGDRLANSSSTLLIVINSFSGGYLLIETVSGATANGNLYLPTAIGTNIVIRYSISPP